MANKYSQTTFKQYDMYGYNLKNNTVIAIVVYKYSFTFLAYGRSMVLS